MCQNSLKCEKECISNVMCESQERAVEVAERLGVLTGKYEGLHLSFQHPRKKAGVAACPCNSAVAWMETGRSSKFAGRPSQNDDLPVL